ncbi:AraC family transcriptional regulator [Ideonella sp. DXS22W]|uniref:AraC family transcriptional regulator n=1 Tax=Pseudaquabacterium inlustre TaxID=2984192 RepID=A0ABU9CMA6_9BURK
MPSPAGTAPLAPDTRSQLLLPSAAIGGCVRAYTERDTRGCVLSEAQRFNHFPATPYCSLVWVLAGDAAIVRTDQPDAPGLAGAPRTPVGADWLISGPQTRPMVSWNPGPALGFWVLLQPDALHALTGLDSAAWCNQLLPAAPLLAQARDAAGWQALDQAVRAAPDTAARVAAVEAFVLPRWQAARPAQPLGLHHARDWAVAVAQRAATSGPGRSLRQLERRIKRHTGLPMRELRVLSRAEAAFFQVRAEPDGERPRWAEVASDVGYADQAHLCRETRRVTGFTPSELRQRIAEDEAFWAYRLWI